MFVTENIEKFEPWMVSGPDASGLSAPFNNSNTDENHPTERPHENYTKRIGMESWNEMQISEEIDRDVEENKFNKIVDDRAS